LPVPLAMCTLMTFDDVECLGSLTLNPIEGRWHARVLSDVRDTEVRVVRVTGQDFVLTSPLLRKPSTIERACVNPLTARPRSSVLACGLV
jgi:hypothetical protein